MIKMQTLILETLLFYNKLVYSMNLRISCSSCSRACVTVGGSWGLDALNKNNDYVKKKMQNWWNRLFPHSVPLNAQ